RRPCGSRKKPDAVPGTDAAAYHYAQAPRENPMSDMKATMQRAVAWWIAPLGVVFGDIGTSPLYTFKVIVDLAGSQPSKAAILGFLSLIIWTLIIIPTIKYVSFAMRINNDGEGGILALMSLVGTKRYGPGIVAVGLFG